MNINDISYKALQHLHSSHKAPTPAAYFEAFYEIARVEGVGVTEELNWRTQWLNKFDKHIQNQLKNVSNPDEFIDRVSLLLKEYKESYALEHTQWLKNLNRGLLGVISDIFSIGAKNKFHFLFSLGGLNSLEVTKKLVGYWEHFRDSKVHLGVLKRLVGIIVYILRTPDNRGAINKEALEIASTLMMHPESLVDTDLLKRIEKVLGIKGAQEIKSPPIQTSALHNVCVAIFKINHLHFLHQENGADTHQAMYKAIEIAQKVCLHTFKESILLEHYQNGFVCVFQNLTPNELFKKANTIMQQAQKVSYQGMLFSFNISVEVLKERDFTSFEELKQKIQHKLKDLC
ncbi:hypothetical protein OQH61_01365 [Helicobacter sp. MIT 21-1697]|uniref:hypothetical protein n=1 Tax=Helicobacter sp. MIT 21-1697 TaxID=2993733 RepID=UPI00224B634B|nr:hypothetical protein [Helicobacter sp. MIT 21-1697]MCX2716388.1 hypothetical protein [Helicobacter sp. MIT 21-1697]